MRIQHRYAFAAIAALLLSTAGVFATPAPPHAEVGEDRFPDADAVVLRHEQTFTLDADRTIRVKEHKWIKMLSSRATRRLADPRIDFRDGDERITILTARTHTPNGDVIDVPDYSRNLVSPFGVANEPAFSAHRQWVVSFSGVQDGAIYELEYERVRNPQELPWMSADLRLADDDPTIERTVTVHLQPGGSLRHQLDHVPADRVQYEESNNGRTHTWTFSNLDDCRDESAAPDWRTRCPRLRFTTCSNPDAWAGILLSAVTQCATPGAAIAKFAEDAIEDETEPREQVRKICELLGKRMRTVDAAVAWEGPRGRLAEAVFGSRYQNALEAAAVTLVALRAAGLDAVPAIAVDQRSFAGEAPVDADVRGFWLVVSTPTERLYVHPTRGIEQAYGDNLHTLVFTQDENNKIRSHALAHGRVDDTRRLGLRVNLEIDAGGAVTGRVRVELGGPLVDAHGLESDDKKKRQVESIVQRVFPGASVSNLSVLAFTPNEFRAEADLKIEDGLTKLGRLRLLEWTDRVPAADGVNLPLEPRDRDADVALGTPVEESIELTVEIPETWQIAVQPESLPPNAAAGPTATIIQRTTVDGRRLRVERRVRLPRELALQQFVAVRESINRLRSNAWRQIALHADKN